MVMKLILKGINSFVRKQTEKVVKKNSCIHIAKSAVIYSYKDIWCKSGTIKIGENTRINGICMIGTNGGRIEIGNDVLIGPGAVVSTAHHNFDRLDVPINSQGITNSPIVIEDDVWIGAHCTILGGAKIGAHSVIGANSLVNGEIPPYSVAYGVPCRVKRIRVPKINQKLLNEIALTV